MLVSNAKIWFSFKFVWVLKVPVDFFWRLNTLVCLGFTSSVTIVVAHPSSHFTFSSKTSLFSPFSWFLQFSSCTIYLIVKSGLLSFSSLFSQYVRLFSFIIFFRTSLFSPFSCLPIFKEWIACWDCCNVEDVKICSFSGPNSVPSTSNLISSHPFFSRE